MEIYKPLIPFKNEGTEAKWTTNKTLVDAGIIVCAFCGTPISIDDIDCLNCGQESTYIYKNKIYRNGLA